MGIEVACECGARFMAADHLAGRGVQCTACGRSFVVPSLSPITAACACGARYQVKAALAGQRVKCVKCGQSFVVARPDAKQPAAPVRPAAAAPNSFGEPDPFGMPSGPSSGAFDADPLGASSGDPFGFGGPASGSSAFPGDSSAFSGAASSASSPSSPNARASSGSFGAVTGPTAPGATASAGAPVEPTKSRRAGVLLGGVAAAGAAVVLLVAVVFLFGGGGSGFATPEEAYVAVREASLKQDWGAAYDAMTVDTQETLVGMCAIYVVLNPLQDAEVAAFGKPPTIDVAKLATDHQLSPNNRAAIQSLTLERMRRVGQSVPDGRSFFVAAMPHLHRGATSADASSFRRLAHPLVGEQLGDLEIVNYMQQPDDLVAGRVSGRTLWFRKSYGKWRVALVLSA